VALTEALSVVAMGAVPGEWIAEVLMTPGFELCGLVAILSDTDDRAPDAVLGPPQWLGTLNQPALGYFLSHPTLEPTLVPGNEASVGTALTRINEAMEDVTSAAVDAKFLEATPRAKKGWFAYELAAVLSDALEDGQQISIPPQINDLLEFLMPDPVVDGDAEPGSEEQESEVDEPSEAD
jgi:putative ATP-dependent endonuclease of OLD family